jgi:hypothetical protein
MGILSGSFRRHKVGDKIDRSVRKTQKKVEAAKAVRDLERYKLELKQKRLREKISGDEA